MNSSIQLFDYAGQSVRVTLIDGEPWFVGKDVASVLGYSNTRDALKVHVDDEDKQTLGNLDESRITTPSNGLERSMVLINESGVYSLIFSSQLPTAKQFKHWVTSEVLPAIRKTGSYTLPEKKGHKSKKSEQVFPPHSAAVKAAEKILPKVFKCKKNEDFQAVLALDEAFKLSFGQSLLEQIGIRLAKKKVEVPTTWEDRKFLKPSEYTWSKWVDVLYWEHQYNTDELAVDYGKREYLE